MMFVDRVDRPWMLLAFGLPLLALSGWALTLGTIGSTNGPTVFGLALMGSTFLVRKILV